MKLIRELNNDDILTVLRNYFNVPKAFIMSEVKFTDEDNWDIKYSIIEDGYEVS